MKIHVCPRDWTHTKDPFLPTHLLSLQNPEAQVEDLRPPWIPPEHHHIAYFYDADILDHPHAPTREDVVGVLDWLRPLCGPDSDHRLLIHCDAGLGRSTACGYLAWFLHLGPGREEEAFHRMVRSSHETKLVPNSIIIAHADDLLNRHGTLKAPLTAWNKRVPWRRTFR